MRTFVIGDIHGGLRALIQLLNKLEVDEEDAFIFMGDYVDGWSESAQVIQFLIELSQKFNCIFIKGNHDVWCENWLNTQDVNMTWYMHGGKETMESYNGFSNDEIQKHLEFFKNLKKYHLDNKNRLYVHAGFTSKQGVDKETVGESFYYDRTLWEMAISLDKPISEHSQTDPNRLKHYHEIYIGHTPTINYNSYEPMNAANIWNVDTGAAFYGKLSALDVNTKEFFQSDVVRTLYPNEKGRNAF